MSVSLSNLRKVKAVHPPRIVLYGVQGVGKTSLAVEAPAPVFVQTEEGTPGDAEIDSFGALSTYDEVMEAFISLYQEEHTFKTVVVDTLDALEPLVWRKTCEVNDWKDIEDAGYGKGYVAADAVWRDYLGAINALRLHKGMNIIQIAHSEIARFNSPISEPYDRYHIKLHKRGSALLQEDADVVMFLNYLTSVKQTEVGFNKKVAHGEGAGQRMMYFEERPGFLAKNRYGMPASMPYDKGKGWSKVAPYFPGQFVPDQDESKSAAKPAKK